MNTTIEFLSSSNTEKSVEAASASPWTSSKQAKFEDRVLRPVYATRRYRFNSGMNWFRILPALQTSAHGWMLGAHAINYEGGRFAHPKTLQSGARSVFDRAYAWAKQHCPEALYSKTNKKGARLLSDPLAICWIIVEENGHSVLRLLQLSGYDGSRGGHPALGYAIYQAARQYENGKLVSDAIDPEGGFLVGVEKLEPKGSKYPIYKVRVGRTPSPMPEHLAKLDGEELRALCALEETVQILTEEEQWKCLERVISPKTVAQIRAELEAVGDRSRTQFTAPAASILETRTGNDLSHSDA